MVGGPAIWRARGPVRHILKALRKNVFSEDFACRIAEHWERVVRWFQSRVSNGVLEAISSLVQAANRRARGYRTTENLIAIVYLTVGKLDFGLA